MASEYIKKIAKFSPDAIEQAVARAITSDEEQAQLVQTLGKVSELFAEPTKKRKLEPRRNLPSDKTVFEERVVPQIRERLLRYEQLEIQGQTEEWKVHLEFQTDFSAMELPQLKESHQTLLKQEQEIGNLNLVVKFYRGVLYLSAYKFAPQTECRQWFRQEFQVVYEIALRYMTTALLIKRYPKLLVCGLSFNQLQKHNKRLVSFLEKDEELAEQLACPLNVTIQNKALNIHPAKSALYVPRYNFVVDPDIVYADPTCDEEFEDEESREFHSWIKKRCETGEIFDITNPPDNEYEEMEGNLAAMTSLAIDDSTKKE